MADDIPGTADDDLLPGTEEGELVKGLGGDDTLYGYGGDDTLLGGSGVDDLFGGADADKLKGGGGDDVLHGDDGDDLLIGARGSDTLDGGEGNDTYRVVAADADTTDVFSDSGSGGTDTLDATRVTTLQLSDSFDATSGLEILQGNLDTGLSLIGGANPVLWDFLLMTLVNVDLIQGSTGGDEISGSDADDRIKGLGGDDVLSGNGGVDNLAGGGGNDLLDGGAGNDVLKGGTGKDFLDGAEGDDVLKGGDGRDVLIYDDADTEKVHGGAGTDTLQIVGADVALDITAAAGTLYQDIEVIDITGSGNNTLVLNKASLRDLSTETDTLRVLGDPGDVVSATGNWTPNGIVEINGVLYREYLGGNATLQVEQGVARTGLDSAPPSIIELSSLDGTNGFSIPGSAEGDTAGISVHSAGDVNGDGFDDVIIGAFRSDANGEDSGSAYVLFGNATGFDPTVFPTDLDGTNGFVILGEAPGDNFGMSVSAAGDINGDGYSDILVGAYRQGANGHHAGAVYVVFGKASGFAAELQASGLDGIDGFKLGGVSASDITGVSVSAGDDINGDGFADFLVGAPGTLFSGSPSGTAYVLFGGATSSLTGLNLSALSGDDGFRIMGNDLSGFVGATVAAGGDINGDGFGDIVVSNNMGNSSSPVNQVYVIYGRASGFDDVFNISTLDGGNGFAITGEMSFDSTGAAVDASGDFNGDGYDDVLIGTMRADANGDRSGAAYLLFGQGTGMDAETHLSALDGSNGFKMSGVSASDYAGMSVSFAGDVNGDGFDDILVGAPHADTNGIYSGATYLVFGGNLLLPANMELSSLDGSNGLTLPGVTLVVFAGRSVSGGGDINGDGFDDLIIGAYGTRLYGVASGAGHVVFGGDFTNAMTYVGTSDDNSIVGTSADETFVGGLGNDLLQGDAGIDTVNGGGGDDTVEGGTGADLIFGGAGADSLNGGDGVDRLEGDNGADTLSGGLGNDVLTGGAGNDTFLFDDALGAGNVDTIMDFGGAGAMVMDVIHLDNAIFTALTDGALTGAALESGASLTEAATAAGRIIYNTTSGALYYDEDGVGGVAAVQFAVIATDVDGLSATDFLVV